MATGAVTLALERLRLVHALALDASRATRAGHLRLGRIFSVRNLLADASGIAAAAPKPQTRRDDDEGDAPPRSERIGPA